NPSRAGKRSPMASTDESPMRGLLMSWPGLVTLLVAVAGLILARPRLESSRPTSVAAQSLGPEAADRSVPSRLWPDPVAALPETEPRGQGFQPAWEDGGDLGKKKPILFLFAVVPADMTPESVETRRRERYATLSALGTAGYVPLRADRLSCVSVLLENPDEF